MNISNTQFQYEKHSGEQSTSNGNHVFISGRICSAFYTFNSLRQLFIHLTKANASKDNLQNVVCSQSFPLNFCKQTGTTEGQRRREPVKNLIDLFLLSTTC